jgi:hypothetical protein
MNSRSNWTPDEKEALQSIVSGTPTSDTLRWLGKLSPSGNGLGLGLNIAGVAAGLASGGSTAAATAVPLVGAASKVAADTITKRAAAGLDSLIRSGGVKPPPTPFQIATQNVDLPMSSIMMNAGVNSSLQRADPDSRSAALAKVLTQAAPPSGGMGDVFGQ